MFNRIFSNVLSARALISHQCKRKLTILTHLSKENGSFNEQQFDEILNESEYQEIASRQLDLGSSKNCYIIQPYIKWGPQKVHDITPEESLAEAKGLISTLPGWTVEDTVIVPLETMSKKFLFGRGNLEKLTQTIKRTGAISSVFINMEMLKNVQTANLQREFGVPVLDRYRVVMQILRMHATTSHAKLQVALAELQYLQRMAAETQGGKLAQERIKMMFQKREQKLKTAIKDMHTHRSLLRNKRQKREFPIVAVVGYTNAGKSSLIQALTGENLIASSRMFTTLDVTLHKGTLPSGLEVLYVDTVGFISDIPTNLIECFIITLEDAMLADLIVHIEDISSSSYEFKRKHVLKTLENLAAQTNTKDISNKIISVGNKSDLVPENKNFGDILRISAKNHTGLDVLRVILERKILEVTQRRKIKIKVPQGGNEIRWLYKNSTVISETPDSQANQHVIAEVIITNSKLQQFVHHFS